MRCLLKEFETKVILHVVFRERVLPAQREFSVPGFFCVASGHFNKEHGVEMWLCNLEHIPVNDPISGQLTYASFDLDQMVIIHREPRILILSVGLCGEAVTFVGIYAPHQKYGTQAVIKFWEHVFALFRDLKID